MLLLLIDAVAYQHILKEQEEKDNKLTAMEKQFNEMQSQMKSLILLFSYEGTNITK
jgi:glutathionylspermidine synthase